MHISGSDSCNKLLQHHESARQAAAACTKLAVACTFISKAPVWHPDSLIIKAYMLCT
jgi:hypothetical protein